MAKKDGNLVKSEITLKRGKKDMGNILHLKEHRLKDKSCSLVEMIMNPSKRKQCFDYYDSKYEETNDEKKIFETMSLRRKR